MHAESLEAFKSENSWTTTLAWQCLGFILGTNPIGCMTLALISLRSWPKSLQRNFLLSNLCGVGEEFSGVQAEGLWDKLAKVERLHLYRGYPASGIWIESQKYTGWIEGLQSSGTGVASLKTHSSSLQPETHSVPHELCLAGCLSICPGHKEFQPVLICKISLHPLSILLPPNLVCPEKRCKICY